MNPPSAKKIRTELKAHGHIRIDNYYWLNKRDDPEVIEYLQKENAYTEKCLKHTEVLQEELYKEMVGRIKQDDSSVPYKDNGYFYYVRYEAGKEYPIYCRKKETLEAEEEILLNVNEMAVGYNYFQVSGLSVSQDNKLISYGVDTTGRRIYSVHFKNIEKNELLPDVITNTTGHAAWANDNRTIFYSVKDDSLRPFKIMRHRLGEALAQDIEIFTELDETFHIAVYKSRSDKFIMIGCFSNTTTEYRFLDANAPDGEFKMIQPRIKDHEYYVEHFEDKFFIRTNNEAQNFRIMTAPIDNPAMVRWTELISYSENILQQDFVVFRDYLVLQERINGLTRLRIRDSRKNEQHYLDFGEAAYTANLSINPSFDTDIVRYSYSSLTTPNSVFDYNMRTHEKVLLKEEQVLGGFDKDSYFTERINATTEDGQLIPISLVYRKGAKKDGTDPLFLYSYGSYGITTEPGFNSARLSLLDRGFIFAIAHIRGGEDLGRFWYEDGKLLKKKNTFTDFITCAEHLVKEKYTSTEKLCILGGSAGGLLVGAVINMRPNLFKAAVAAVPFVDVVTTMLDDTIPLTTGEYDEWGNPNEKEYYDYILSYSPYDNVQKKEYPALLVTTGLYDSQVQYWEPAKWVAKLRDYKTDNNILLLHTNMEAGHGGASGRFRRLKETALEYAFLIDQVNKKK